MLGRIFFGKPVPTPHRVPGMLFRKMLRATASKDKTIMRRSVVLIRNRAWLPLSVGAALTLTLFALWAASARPGPVFDARCESLDDAASRALGNLVTDRNIETEQRLADALFRLRRARNHCRHGLIGLARLDYQALTDGRYSNYRKLGEYQALSQR